MLGVRIQALLRRSRKILLVELAVLAVLAIGVAIVLWWPDGGSKPAATGGSPAPIELPGLPDSTAPVLMPGRPGEPAQSRPANEMSAMPRAAHNNADIRFVTMMIPHHEQALVMARLVAERGENPKIKSIADRILAGQEPEIKVLEAWLADRGLDRNSGGDHRHSMSGMQSAEALNRLTAARGAEFDQMFVAMMTDHHQGAIEMGREALTLGADVIINEMAGSVVVEQGVEINRMREALASPN
ncbi:Uncharacterized conserved protein, DUF305 family [Micromonospora phaseoli]|uniref:Uncharacterized conserved protein, DUF305 family n=1 Tax=Micromonospora phaseoli TaxID=1144548 RepID=A0A1H6VPQ1_9ACTN|nr:DUF305 domain-containing protein [Micromonospora phaseoli]PZV93601.1 uncharacterized protein (DUF305 family) [Micromonospora phaseoli]GIJ80230.1 hypothetical protein Xph01_46620 [Micromonospora phaseoli]SEJ02640.1 Uncharacterized conserved protein, DUF305 family [Micromonospora phaseoli]